MSELQTWLVVAAGAVALPVVSLGLGLVWSGRRIAQVEAERRAALRGAFTSVGLPARDEVVHLLLNADRETSTFAFACHEPGLGWIDADTSLPITEVPYGWRPHPFFPGRRRMVDRDLTATDVARELARLFPQERGNQITATRRAELASDDGADRHREGGND